MLEQYFDKAGVDERATALAEAVTSRRTTALDTTTAALSRARAAEPHLLAWVHLDDDTALAQARRVDDALGSGASPLPLAGVPVAVKDIFDTSDMPTCHGSRLFAGHRPAADAACVAAVRRAGGILLGKSVTTEFAFLNPGPTRNPHGLSHSPGGSSSGSAAAVAAGIVPLAFGSQTAGSLIRPASYCGVFGFKPTAGQFSLAGSHALAPSLDTLGWMARSADDLELMRSALAGSPYEPLPTRSSGSIGLGLCRTHEWPLLQPSGVHVWEQAEAIVRKAGFRVETRDVPDAWQGLAQAHKTVMAYEVCRGMDPLRNAHPDGLSVELIALMDEGSHIDDDAHAAAKALAALAHEQLDEWMGTVDVLLVPAAPGEAPEGLHATGDSIFNRVWTLLGLPCVTIPGLVSPSGMPVGVQLVGRRGDDRRVLECAAAVHEALAAAQALR